MAEAIFARKKTRSRKFLSRIPEVPSIPSLPPSVYFWRIFPSLFKGSGGAKVPGERDVR